MAIGCFVGYILFGRKGGGEGCGLDAWGDGGGLRDISSLAERRLCYTIGVVAQRS